MAFCPNCGAELKEGAAFCASCGAPVNKAAEPAPQPAPQPQTQPVSVYVNTFGTGVIPDEDIQAAVSEVFDFTPGGIIRDLDLRKPVFAATSAYGHFGRPDADFTWERTDKADVLRKAAENISRSAG